MPDGPAPAKDQIAAQTLCECKQQRVAADLSGSADDARRSFERAEAEDAALEQLGGSGDADDERVVVETIPRERIWLAQTPQGFRREVIERAVALGQSGVEATDEAMLAEAGGLDVAAAGEQEAVDAGTFRLDLLYRLQVVEIHIPPLRERKEDIVPLGTHFLAKYAKENGREPLSLSPEATAILHAYGWPGNVRELENTMERATVLSSPSEDTLLPKHLPGSVLKAAA